MASKKTATTAESAATKTTRAKGPAKASSVGGAANASRANAAPARPAAKAGAVKANAVAPKASTPKSDAAGKAKTAAVTTKATTAKVAGVKAAKATSGGGKPAKDATATKATKTPSAAKATKETAPAKTTKTPSAAKATKTTKAPKASGAKKAASAATTTKAPKAAKRAPRTAAATSSPADGVAVSDAESLGIVRAVFDALGWTYKLAPGEGGSTEFYVNTRGDKTFQGVKAFHYTGRFVIFGAAPFTVPESRLDEACKYVSYVNNALQDGCLMVRAPAPAEVTFRTAVNFTRVAHLDPGLVTGAISDLMEGAGATFAGLAAVAKGATADAAFDAL